MKRSINNIIVAFCLFAIIFLGASCGNKTNQDDATEDIDAMFPDKELTAEETEFIMAVNELDFEEQIGSDRCIIYTCSDESNGFPSQIAFSFNFGMKYTLWGLSMDAWHGDFIVENGKVTLLSNTELTETQEKIVFDIIDGNKLAYNAKLSSEDSEYELVIVGPNKSKPDIDGMMFEPNAKESMQYNFDGFE